jgi:glucose-6-phosphate isomerase
VHAQSCLWDVNAFDQWGVELGKELATALVAEIEGGALGPHDASTRAALERARRLRG